MFWKKDLKVLLQPSTTVSYQSGYVTHRHPMPAYPTAEQWFQPLPEMRYAAMQTTPVSRLNPVSLGTTLGQHAP